MSLARPIVRRVAAPFARGLTEPPLGGLEGAIAALFPDVWYDPSDLTTLFQDSAGTTPVTALEQPVGLMLDKSRGLVLGSENLSNTGNPFSATTGYSSAVTNTSTAAVSGGELVVTPTATNGRQIISFTAVVGKWYQLSFTMRRVSGDGAAFASFSTSNSGASAIAGPNTTNSTLTSGTVIYLATATTTYVTLGNSGGAGVCAFGGFSVRELPGNHAYHTPGDTTTRPVVSRRINLLTKTEAFADAVWGKSNATVAPNATTAPDGASTADTITLAAGTAQKQITNGTSYTGAGYTVSFYFKTSTLSSNFVQIALGGNVSYLTNFNIATGATGTNNLGGSINSVGDGWYRATVLSKPSWNGNIYIIAVDSGTAGFAASTTATGSFYIWGASLVPAELGALPYQRVNTTTDYDSDASKFPTFLRTDGVNDSLQTNAIDFTGTDKMFVGAAIRKLSDAAVGLIIEFSANSLGNNGAFALLTRTGAAPEYPQFISRGTSSAVPAAGPYATPANLILSGIGDISGDSAILRVNGAQAASSTADQGTGNYSSNKLYLFMRAGTSLPFLGWFYGSVIKGATLSASQIALADRWLASKTKTVTLA